MNTTREAVWAAAMKRLETPGKPLSPEIPEVFQDILTLKTCQHLLELADEFYMGSHRHFLSNIANPLQSAQYHCFNVDNLYAFRHLIDPESAVTQRASIIQLSQCLGGMTGPDSRFDAVDYTTPEHYEPALARLTVAVGVFNLGTYEFQRRKLLEYRNGTYVLPVALDELVMRHMDKAETIVRLIDERKMSSDDFGILDGMLSSGVPLSLVNGVL